MLWFCWSQVAGRVHWEDQSLQLAEMGNAGVSSLRIREVGVKCSVCAELVQRALLKWPLVFQASLTTESWSLVEVWGISKGLFFYFLFMLSSLSWFSWEVVLSPSSECLQWFRLNLDPGASLLDHFSTITMCRQCLVPHLEASHLANFTFKMLSVYCCHRVVQVFPLPVLILGLAAFLISFLAQYLQFTCASCSSWCYCPH